MGIADAEIISGGYERFYLKENEEIIDDSLVKMKIVTADYKVPQLMKFIEENNPNEQQKQIPLLAAQMTGGSKDYIKWVKDAFKEEDKDDEKKEDDKKKEEDPKPDDDSNVEENEEASKSKPSKKAAKSKSKKSK